MSNEITTKTEGNHTHLLDYKGRKIGKVVNVGGKGVSFRAVLAPTRRDFGGERGVFATFDAAADHILYLSGWGD